MKSLEKLIASKFDISQGITLINAMGQNEFKRLIDIAYKSEECTITKEELISNLIKEINLESTENEQIIKVLLHLKNVLGKLIIKPKDLQDFLTEKINLNTDKAEIFIKTWSSKPNLILNKLKTGQHLDGIAWELYTEVAENNTFTFPNIKGKLQFFIVDNSNVTDDLSLDLKHSEVYKLYSEFEKIQNVLDNLK